MTLARILHEKSEKIHSKPNKSILPIPYCLQSLGRNYNQSYIQAKKNLLFVQACFDWVKQALHPEYLSLTRKIRARYPAASFEVAHFYKSVPESLSYPLSNPIMKACK